MRKEKKFWGTVVLSMAIFFMSAGAVTAAEVNLLPFAGTQQPLIIEASGNVQVNGSTVTLYGNLLTVETADMNNDGVADIIAGGETLFVYDVKNSQYLWAIDEGAQYELSRAINDLAVADITGDGTPEVVTIDTYSGYSGLSLWDVTGSGTAPIWSQDVHSVAREYTSPSHVEVLEIADLDEDGNLDIVVGGYLGDIDTNADGTPDTNIGAYGIAAFQASDGAYLWHFATSADVTCIEVGDIDGDGSPEVAAGDIDGWVYCRNGEDGSEVFTATVPYISDCGVEDIELADFDADGDEDIAAGSEEYIIAYDENGTAIWSYNGFAADSRSWSDLELADFNQDGVPDVAAINKYGWVVINGANGSEIYSGGIFGFGSVAAVGDLDGDGTPELVCGDDITTTSVDVETGGWLWMHENSGYVHDLEVDDFTGEGSNGIAGVAGTGGGDFVYVLAGKTSYSYSAVAGKPVEFNWGDDTYTGFDDVAAADADLDGDADLILADSRLSWIYAVDGDSGSKIWEYECLGAAPEVLATGDFDGDGNTEIAAFGGTSLYMLDSDGTELDSATLTISPHHFLVADIDGDGSDDLVMGERRGAVTAYSYPGGEIFTTVAIPNFSYESDRSQKEIGLAYGDVSGDGEAQLLALGYETGALNPYHVYEINVSDGSASSVANSANAWTTIALAQVDGDAQKKEILLGHSGGIDAVDGDTGFGVWQSAAHPSNNGLLAVDLDGDGYDEAISGGSNNIYGIDHDGTVLWSKDFTGTVENYNNDESGTLLGDMVLADLDGDGDLDVAAAFQTGVNLHLLDAATGQALIDAVLLNACDTGEIQLAAGDFSPQTGTEVAVSTKFTTSIFGTIVQINEDPADEEDSASSGDAVLSSSSSGGGGGCFISTIQ